MLYAEAAAIAARASKSQNLSEALPVLRQLPLDDFGLLMLDPAAHGLGEILPPMPPDEIQKTWTGGCGTTLLPLSLTFMRTLESLNARFKRRSMFEKTFLDYGCGWGRLLRLALYYSDPDKLIGVDAWDVSLGFCREAGAPATLHKIAAVPEKLPAMAPVDIAYAFSIFTHLPESTFRAALNATLGVVADDGMFVFTFRPLEYWEQEPALDESGRNQRKNEHLSQGRTFLASSFDAGYGDASMSHGFVDRVLAECGWRRLAFDRSLVDPMQEIVVATPA
jgi:Methyltransferase domain